MVVALAVKLARAGKLKPSLEVFGYGFVEQRVLGVARVVELVELGFEARWPARVGLEVHWAGGGRHGAVPARAGCLMSLWLYSALWFSLLPAGSPVTPELLAAAVAIEKAHLYYRPVFAFEFIWITED